MMNKDFKQKLSTPVVIGLISLGIFTFVLFFLNRHTPTPATWGAAGGVRDGIGDWFNAISRALLMPMIGGILGYLVVRQRTHSRMGWLLIILSMVFLLDLTFIEWTVFQLFTRPTPLFGSMFFAWLANWYWVIALIAYYYVVAVFPTGKFYSKAWRNLILTTFVIFLTSAIAFMIETPLIASAFGVKNPFFTNTNQSVVLNLYYVGLVGQLGGPLAILVATILRFHQSRDIVRQQMKWLLIGVFISVTQIVAGVLLSISDFVIGEFIVNSALLGLFLGMGIALWRHQLFDIDVIIRRTLQYSLLSGILAAVYFATVALIQRAITAIGGQPSAVVIVISTLLIAALFNPLRTRIQKLINRRFYRSEYDAQAMLARFAETARDEVEIEHLTAGLVQVVQETLQPKRISFWLKTSHDEK